jgi:hypothetical protein
MRYQQIKRFDSVEEVNEFFKTHKSVDVWISQDGKIFYLMWIERKISLRDLFEK